MKQDFSELAKSVLKVSRNTLTIHLRFMDVAISRLRWISIPELILKKPELALLLADVPLATEGTVILYDPLKLCRMYAEDKNNGPRAYLHLLLHGVFRHFDVDASILRPLWNLACDMAVEGVINSLDLPSLANAKTAQQQHELARLAPSVGHLLTAEKIYAFLRQHPPKESELKRLTALFSPDDHSVWYAQALRITLVGGAGESDPDTGEGDPNTSDRQEESGGVPTLKTVNEAWQRVAERIQTDLETFHKQRGDAAGSLMQNLRAVNREKYDYTAFLKKFAVPGEVMRISDDEFDYVYYTYGMSLFPEKRMPLIEPLEYKDAKRIREFVIAIDTSGSVAGEQVQTFLQKTYNILQSTESFFSRINVHILQCDAEIQEDVKITSREEFDHYLKTMQIKGLGGTNFRPVFQHVDQMIAEKEFAHLSGLIYFTDGYGTFPTQMPAYKTAFIFVEEGYTIPEVPVWAMKLVLTREDVEEMMEIAE